MRASGFFPALWEICAGKSATRTFTNLLLRQYPLFGEALDVGGNRQESHYRFLKRAPDTVIHTLNIAPETKPDYIVDLETSPIPVSAEYFDTVLCFNLLEHVEHFDTVIAEMYRVLK